MKKPPRCLLTEKKLPSEWLDLLEFDWEEKSLCWKFRVEDAKKHDQKNYERSVRDSALTMLK